MIAVRSHSSAVRATHSQIAFALIVVLACMVFAPRAAGDTPPGPTTGQTTTGPTPVTNPVTGVTPQPDPAPPPKKTPPPTPSRSAPVSHSAPPSHKVTPVQPAPAFITPTPSPPAAPAAITRTPHPVAKKRVPAAPAKHHPAPSSALDGPATSPAVQQQSTKPAASSPSPAPSEAPPLHRAVATRGDAQLCRSRPGRSYRHRRRAAPCPRPDARGRPPPPPRRPAGCAAPAVDRCGRHLTALREPHPVHAQLVGSRTVRLALPALEAAQSAWRRGTRLGSPA